MTIDTSYFFGDLSIAQISEASVTANLTALINQYETEFLTDLLGYELYKGYLTGIAVTPTPAVKWTDLRNGKEYTNSLNYLDKYQGLIFTEGTAKKSPIANYVYFKYMADNASFTTGSGEKKVAKANTVDVAPKVKMCRAWNEMVKWNSQIINFLYNNTDTYPEFRNGYSGQSGPFGYQSVSPLQNLLTRINPVF